MAGRTSWAPCFSASYVRFPSNGVTVVVDEVCKFLFLSFQCRDAFTKLFDLQTKLTVFDPELFVLDSNFGVLDSNFFDLGQNFLDLTILALNSVYVEFSGSFISLAFDGSLSSLS